MTLRVQEFGHDWSNWTPRVRATLMFVIDRPAGQVLLIRKLRGFGEGKVNGPGGKIHADESPVDAAMRETIEETGIEPVSPRAVGHIAFQFLDGLTIGVDLFVAEAWTGNLRPCEEADPFWCALDAIPYDTMWQDDRHWLPEVLEGGTIRARFLFDGERMLECHLVLGE